MAKLRRLDLLQSLFGKIVVPAPVYHEVVIMGRAQGAADASVAARFLDAVEWRPVTVPSPLLEQQRFQIQLGRGEQAVIALAMTVEQPLLLLDDELARIEARRRNLKVKGTLGCIVQAVQQGHLSVDEADALLHEIADRTDIWISGSLCQQVLSLIRST
ncbi:MAG: DUF3368 domain-containing protein [Ardenticatenales bacterium]|nr:DUF3368 domain-containing protein [Ardenticatenales bacterium]